MKTEQITVKRVEDFMVGDQAGPGWACTAVCEDYARFSKSMSRYWDVDEDALETFGGVTVTRACELEPWHTVLGHGIVRVTNAPEGWHVGMPVVIYPEGTEPAPVMPDYIGEWLQRIENSRMGWSDCAKNTAQWLRDYFRVGE